MSKWKRRLLFSLRPITSTISSLYDLFDRWSLVATFSSFQDRDGTLKSYSCAYSASIQPAYSGVIQVISPHLDLWSLFSSQAQFARRCAQTCAILTTAPMMNMGILDVGTIPEGWDENDPWIIFIYKYGFIRTKHFRYYYYGASGGREWYVSPSVKFRDSSIQNPEQALLDEVFYISK